MKTKTTTNGICSKTVSAANLEIYSGITQQYRHLITDHGKGHDWFQKFRQVKT